MKLAERTKRVKTSPTLALAAKAIELKSKGVDVVSLSVGEPDWSTFEICKKAGLEAIDKNITKYTAASGAMNLKKALADKFSKRYSLNLEAANIIVTPGAKYALQESLWNLINPGDKVGVFIPFWASYTTMVEIAQGVPELISLNPDMSLNVESLEEALNSGVKVLLINSPNNPSGASLGLEDYKKLSVLLKTFPDVQVILDDIYAELYWGEGSNPCPHLFDVAPELFSRTILVNGASKAYSMTGWRIGWAIGGKDIIGGLSRLQSQTTGCPNSIAQEATCAGILEGDADIKTSVLKLKKRAELGFDLLSKISGLKVTKPTGAFYFWVDLSDLLNKWGLSDADFCSRLLESKAVVVVPGAEFGQPGFMRMSFAVSEEVFSEGVKRLADFIKEQV